MAAVNGSLDIVTLLLQHGGDPNLATSCTDKDGKPVVSASNVYNMHASSFARTYAYIYLIVALLPELITSYPNVFMVSYLKYKFYLSFITVCFYSFFIVCKTQSSARQTSDAAEPCKKGCEQCAKYVYNKACSCRKCHKKWDVQKQHPEVSQNTLSEEVIIDVVDVQL